ncbi:hypothetical protein QFZ22_000384 [Streptomyces canus]|uniref:Uncharacterized protein n=1 Tax=Streptomyces canus TaxID=58343 RepID=A0AAW8F2R6_9ACTN|nr:hypothetical protein [Streptomyces canus]MDQ0904399.1 hypothetical protein [Streptomyces canus]
MKNIPFRLWVANLMAACGIFRFTQYHFWSSSMHYPRVLGSAAEFFLAAWVMTAGHYALESRKWKARKTAKVPAGLS